MNVFSDLHHTSLFNSLKMLFEDRLGHKLYRPVGLEWHEKGLWCVYDHPATAQQYLSLDPRYKPVDGSPQLNRVVSDSPDYYSILEPEYEYEQKAITYEQFMNMDIDIVIASLPQHIEPYMRLAKEKNAKFIFQIGNAWTHDVLPKEPMNVLASANIEPRDIADNIITYHQEFSLGLFKPVDIRPLKIIRSFMNVPDQFPDYPMLLELEQKLGWNVKIHGGQGRDNPIHGAEALASAIQKSGWIWHVKAGGDGYGHVLFNSAACGIPLIVKRSYYAGKLGEKLLLDGETCIDIDGLSVDQLIDKLNYYTDPERYAEMCNKVYNNFRENVDFDKDAEEVKKFLERLV